MLCELEKEIKNCTKCKLCKTRTNVVVGDGNMGAKIMLIGEGPGENEDLTGVAFVGKAGQLLDKMLLSIGLDRKSVYICNIVKCRPPQNRNPEKDEVTACMDYLRKQYLIMKPKAVLLLGSIACKNILGENFSIMRSHGVEQIKKGVIFMPTFHPSALLRNPDLKKLAWHDLKRFRELLIKENIIE